MLCFNPCFNGSMYKNTTASTVGKASIGFNPCFNGSMYKNADDFYDLMSCYWSFNPCFNGSMYKNNTRPRYQ